MDPATLISLSSVFGLMATFFQERRGRNETQTQATLQEYIEWLERGRHTEIVELLRSNQNLMNATDRFMRAGHDEIINRFDRLEEMLAKSLNSAPGWAEITQSLNPNAQLSKQAVDILRWFEGTGGTKAIEFPPRAGGGGLCPIDGHGNKYEPEAEDTRFFRDDLDSLVRLGYLIALHRAPRETPKYAITRAAVALVASFPDSTDETAHNPA